MQTYKELISMDIFYGFTHLVIAISNSIVWTPLFFPV